MALSSPSLIFFSLGVMCRYPAPPTAQQSACSLSFSQLHRPFFFGKYAQDKTHPVTMPFNPAMSPSLAAISK